MHLLAIHHCISAQIDNVVHALPICISTIFCTSLLVEDHLLLCLISASAFDGAQAEDYEAADRSSGADEHRLALYMGWNFKYGGMMRKDRTAISHS